MNNFHRPHGGLQEADVSEDAHRSPFSDLAGRFANWMTGADQLTVDEAATPQASARPPEPLAADVPEPAMPTSTPAAAPADDGDTARFALAPFGYNRSAVGEQTASILVVAHDQANETTRLAQEQAERCVADAAANAVQMTADAKAKLRELDAETDAVWRERERLLEDVRVVSAALTNLADQASQRFPAEPAPSTGSFERVMGPARGIWEQRDEPTEAPGADDGHPDAIEPQATQP